MLAIDPRPRGIFGHADSIPTRVFAASVSNHTPTPRCRRKLVVARQMLGPSLGRPPRWPPSMSKPQCCLGGWSSTTNDGRPHNKVDCSVVTWPASYTDYVARIASRLARSLHSAPCAYPQPAESDGGESTAQHREENEGASESHCIFRASLRTL